MLITVYLLAIAAYQEVLSSPFLWDPSSQTSSEVAASGAWPYEMCNQPINANVSQGRNEDDLVRKFECDRIVGGSLASKGEFPFMVGLWRIGGSNRPFCGGSLIGDRWVMTAAHCVGNRRIKVVVGDHKPRDSDGDEQHIKVCSTYVHPKYGFSDSDIAILKLCEPVKDSEFVKTIALPEMGLELEELQPLKVAGWGLTKERGDISPTLRVVKVENVDWELCKEAYHYAEKEKICAGIWKYGGKDSCQGDSGGPLWYLNEAEERVLVGIVSSGRGCARPYYPGLYTKVSAFREWIDEIVTN